MLLSKLRRNHALDVSFKPQSHQLFAEHNAFKLGIDKERSLKDSQPQNHLKPIEPGPIFGNIHFFLKHEFFLHFSQLVLLVASVGLDFLLQCHHLACYRVDLGRFVHQFVLVIVI